jgi:hypothetical protein
MSANQVFTVTGELQIKSLTAYRELSGQISFLGALDTKFGQLRVYGQSGTYTLLLDGNNTSGGIAIRSSTTQGPTLIGGQSQKYPFQVGYNGAVDTFQLKVYQPNEQLRTFYGNVVFEVGRYSTRDATALSTLIATFYQDSYKTNEKIYLNVGNTYQNSCCLGYASVSGSPTDSNAYGILGFQKTYQTLQENLKVLYNGNIEIPLQLTAGTISATTYLNLPPVSAGDLLPITLNETKTRVGINNTTPTEALDVIGNVVVSNTISAGGSISAASFVGTLTTALQPNIQTVGTLTDLNVTGTITAGTVSATTYLNLPAPPSTLPITLDTTNNRVGINNITPTETLDVVGNIMSTGSVSASTLSGTLSTNSQPNITSVGTLSSLNVTGAITSGSVSATTLAGTLSSASQPNITSVGTLSSLAVTGAITAGSVSATSFSGTLSTAAQPNITSVGTLGSLTVTGDVAIDSSTLKVDSTNNRVGICNTSPTEALDVTGNIKASGSVTATTLGGTLSTAAQPYVTSVGTLSSLSVSGDVNIDSNTLKVDSTNNRVGINQSTPTQPLDVTGNVNSTGNIYAGNSYVSHAGIVLLGPSTYTTIRSLTGSPEGAVSAEVGSLFLRKDGSTGTTLYTKTSGTGNTGWQAIGASPDIGKTVLAKLSANKAISTTTTNVLSFVLPYVGTYEIVVGLRSTLYVSTAFLGISTASNTLAQNYPTVIRFGGNGAVSYYDNYISYETILYTTSTTNGTYYLNASASGTPSLIATETQLVATYKGSF